MKPRPGILGPLAVAMAIAIGALVVWCVVGIWVVETVSRRFQMRSQDEQLAVRMDGTPLIARYEYSGIYREVTYRTLEGTPEPTERGRLREISGASLATSGTPPRGETSGKLGFTNHWLQRLRQAPSLLVLHSHG